MTTTNTILPQPPVMDETDNLITLATLLAGRIQYYQDDIEYRKERILANPTDENCRAGFIAIEIDSGKRAAVWNVLSEVLSDLEDITDEEWTVARLL